MKSLCFSYSTLFIILIIVLYANSASISKEKYKVVIVGAGISGLGAATHLLKNNITDILLLEASDRIGGRVHTAPFGDYLIEYGAQWAHGQGGNVVYEISEPYGFFETQTFYINGLNVIKQSGSKIDIPVVQKFFSDLRNIVEEYGDSVICNCSQEYYIKTRVAQFVQTHNIDNYTAEALNDVFIKRSKAEHAVSDLSTMSVLTSSQYGETNGSLNIAWKSGYRSFIDILLGKLDGAELPVLEKTKFNKVVQTIDWSGNEVHLTCEDGSQYYADHVITTVSLGVLKHSAKTMFTPPLPERKLSAIQAIGFDVLGKIFVQFNQRWWPLIFNYDVSFLWTEEDKQRFKNESKYGGWTTELFNFHHVVNQPRVLLGWTGAETTRKIEQLSDKELTDALTELFHWFLGDKYEISEVLNVTKTTWASNRFFRGSYSYSSLDADKLGHPRLDLAQPISHNKTNPVLLFAGEATHDKFYGTVHGALESGWREAKRILSF